MDFLKGVKQKFAKGIRSCYGINMDIEDLPLNETRSEFLGDYTFVIFPLVKLLKLSPKEIGDKLGQWMVANEPMVVSFETIQGFVNLSFFR